MLTENQFHNLRPGELICGFQFRGLPLSASGATRTRGWEARDAPAESGPATRDGTIGMLAGVYKSPGEASVCRVIE